MIDAFLQTIVIDPGTFTYLHTTVSLIENYVTPVLIYTIDSLGPLFRWRLFDALLLGAHASLQQRSH